MKIMANLLATANGGQIMQFLADDEPGGMGSGTPMPVSSPGRNDPCPAAVGRIQEMLPSAWHGRLAHVLRVSQLHPSPL